MTRRSDPRWFMWSLAGVAAIALAVRLIYILGTRQHVRFGGDAFFYHAGANLLVDGKGFIWPFEPHRALQTASHPPLYLIYLAIPSILGMTSQLTHLLWSALLGVGTVLIIGLAGRDIAGPRVGVIAAAIAAVYPNLWVPDGSLMAETVAMFATACVLYFSFRYWRHPKVWGLVWVGLAGSAAALSRSELVLMIPLTVIPLAVLAPGPTRRDRFVAVVAGGGAAVLFMSPWLILNMTRFEKPEFLSTQFGALLASTDCDLVWNSNTRSYYSVECADAIRRREMPKGADESVQDGVYRRAGIRYVQDHTDGIPRVVAARLAAIVGLYHPDVQIYLDSVIEGRGDRVARIGLYSFQGLALLSVAGAILLRRARAVPVFPFVVIPGVVLFTVAVGYASTRFRSPVEVIVCLLSAVTIDALIRLLGRRRTGHSDVDTDTIVA